MSKTRKPYPPEFREQILNLYRYTGRHPEFIRRVVLCRRLERF